ncbi:DUF1956 domain-containing protein [Massilia sp. H-1]|nr:DUF1956 domain-containing protein [Massilia sp. H-1]
MRLWYREMLEPTGIWHEEIDNDIRPAHAGLTQVLGRYLNVPAADDDLSRLSFCVVGLALQLMVARDVIDKISPQLLDSDAAIDTWMDRLVDYGSAIVDAERMRRAALTPPHSPP